MGRDTAGEVSEDSFSSLSSSTDENPRTPPQAQRRMANTRQNPRAQRSSSNSTIVPTPPFRLVPAVFTSPREGPSYIYQNPESQATPSPPITQPPPPKTLPSLFSARPIMPPQQPAPQPFIIHPTAPILPLLRGDGTDREQPAIWLQQFKLGVSMGFTEVEQLRRFTAQLEPGNLAQEWYDHLPAQDRASMAALEAAFTAQWPPRRRPKLSRVQQKQHLRGHVLKEMDIGVWQLKEDGGDYKQNIWAEEIVAMAKRVGDLKGTLIDHVIEGIPRLLKDHLNGDYDSWEVFEDAVRAVSVDRIQSDRRRQEENRTRDQAIETLQQQLTQMSLQTARMPRPATAPAPMYTAAAPAAQRPIGGTALLGRAPVAYMPSTPLTRAQILERVASITQQSNTKDGRDQYEQDIADWHRRNPQFAPNLERPYPLRPGTVPAGSGECYKCGHITEPPHTSTTSYETRWRAIVGSMLRRVALRGNPVPVQYVWPVAQPSPYYTGASVPVFMTAPEGEESLENWETDQNLLWEQGNYMGPPPTTD
ncbi:hypothetical protein EV363DRAFT_1402785 [Boletus edulis]|nr:hypothetical protein EV363DRAFT_1402785 [Boletus edulis]